MSKAEIRTTLHDHDTGQVAEVVYDRATKLNTMTTEAIPQLEQVFRDLAGNDDLRCVVLTGAGEKAFVGGADINELAALGTPNRARAFITSLHKSMKAIRDLPVPVIARVDGYALGAGMELAAACDMRICSDRAVFGMPEVRVGIPSVIEAALLPMLVGTGRSNYLVMTGENIDAQTALEWGMADIMVPAADLNAKIEAVVGGILASGARAVRLQKALCQKWERLDVDAAIQAGIDSLASAYETDEPSRMTGAFLNRKR
jgi:enoyl-CoA hydratase